MWLRCVQWWSWPLHVRVAVNGSVMRRCRLSWISSDVRRQQAMERLRTRMRQQEQAGGRQLIGDTALLNSKQRKRLRRREEKTVEVMKKSNADAHSAGVDK